jgi:AcrR family transcriptional regulator
MGPQVVLRNGSGQTVGLRERKKQQTVSAIEEAALDLFEQQGFDATTVEQIAERADVSRTTFFRYFPTKADVVLNPNAGRLPALHRAIVERPPGESDLVALRRALQSGVVATVEAQSSARKSRVLATTPLLRGLSYERGLGWWDTIKRALAERRGSAEPDEHSSVAARAVLGALGSAIDGWVDDGCRGDLAAAVDRSFDALQDVAREWTRAEVQ